MIHYLKKCPSVRLVTSEDTWVEGNAIEQLQKTAQLDGIVTAVGMPDIHPGKGSPVGAAFLSRNLIYPHIIGNDAGCGMSLFQTTLKTKKMKKEKWAGLLDGFNTDDTVFGEEFLEDNGNDIDAFDPGFGTLGGGNHFAELQVVEQVIDPEKLQLLGVDTKRLLLLVHSGSRSHGEMLYRYHTGKLGAGPLRAGTREAEYYLERYSHAVIWASENRTVIAGRFLGIIGGRSDLLIDRCHNSISGIEIDGVDYWLHRKGAAPSDSGPVVIPGSRGTLTYLVQPIGSQEENLWSVAHGAGRKWNRSSCKGKLKGKWTSESLKRTDLGGIVVCEDRELLFEEAPQAYKKIDTVIDDMVSAGLIRVIATLRPVVTVKSGVK